MENEIFTIEDNKILFKPVDLETEVDFIYQARDFVERTYFEEVRRGKAIIFDSWDIEKGYIKFHIKW